MQSFEQKPIGAAAPIIRDGVRGAPSTVKMAFRKIGKIWLRFQGATDAIADKLDRPYFKTRLALHLIG